MSDSIALALIRHLVRTGVLDDADITAIADELDGPDDESAGAAHDVRVCLLEVDAPTESQWKADQARKGFRIVREDEA